MRLFLLGVFTPALALAGPRLFTITRSLNDNIVVYEANVSAAGGFQAKDPVNVYWILGKTGKTEPLSGVERRTAYGVDVESVKAAEAVFVLKALKDRKLTARLKKGAATAWTTVQGKVAAIDSIFIKVAGKGIFAKAMWVEVKGKAEDGTAVVEKIDAGSEN